MVCIGVKFESLINIIDKVNMDKVNNKLFFLCKMYLFEKLSK